MSEPKFPLDYGAVYLFDELQLRAYSQVVEEKQQKIATLGEALEYSRKMKETLIRAETNRIALFSCESIEAHFGLVKQIYNTGWFGRGAAFLFKHLGFDPHK